MAEEKKGVIVTTPTGAVTKAEKLYPNGQGIYVADGHLNVTGPGGSHDVIAIYAPGKWINATVAR